jgi:16S rRNA (cytidine1402-2'-O)-methyltransferase
MITFVPTPIGNPQDITIRAIRAFEEANLFFCEDTRHTKHLIAILQERFGMSEIDAKFVSFNEHNGKQRISQYQDILAKEQIVYVSDAGMPVISDPGQLLVEYAQKHNIEYDVLPGATAVATAYAASGFEDGKFLFFGFLPHKGKDRAKALSDAMNNGYNTVLYEAPHRLDKLLDEIAAIDEHRELFLAKEISKKYQKYYKDSAKNLQEMLKSIDIKGEWVVIIKAKSSQTKSISFDEVYSMDIPPKIKAKLLSSMSDKSTKEWYNLLITK